MPGLGDNIRALAGMRRARETAMANFATPLRLKIVAPSGPNPGALRMLTYVPPGLPPGAPLVVVLHGCTQNAAAYDHGAGWSTLAERHGFALLFPEQQRGNNPNLCFNWFQPEDTARGNGEVESIRQMTEQTIAAHTLDRRRVFITGLSAGGAMTTAMLATAPELFAGGAIIAGLPYGAAGTVQQALAQMRQPPRHTAAEWGRLVRAASPHRGPWPSVQVWHGTGDNVVSPGNADALVLQWSDLLGLAPRPTTSLQEDGARHDVWIGPGGRPALEMWLLPGFGHGTPVGTLGTDADQRVGVPGPHMLAAPVSSTWHLARSWGLLTQPPRAYAHAETRQPAAPTASTPRSVVEQALRATGLMK